MKTILAIQIFTGQKPRLAVAWAMVRVSGLLQPGNVIGKPHPEWIFEFMPGLGPTDMYPKEK